MPIPARELRRVKTVLVVGGTFDPVHRMHVEGPREIARRLYGGDAWVLFVPAARSPFKDRGPVASDEDRVEMLKLALQGAERCSVWEEEIERARKAGRKTGPTRAAKPSYTIDTVKKLKRLLPERVGVRLVIGADQAAGFHGWKSARALFRAARPLVMLREPLDEPGKLFAALEAAGFWTRAELRAWAESIAPTEVVRVAATGVREAVGSGVASATLVGEMDERVMGYIRERGLYR